MHSGEFFIWVTYDRLRNGNAEVMPGVERYIRLCVLDSCPGLCRDPSKTCPTSWAVVHLPPSEATMQAGLPRMCPPQPRPPEMELHAMRKRGHACQAGVRPEKDTRRSD